MKKSKAKDLQPAPSQVEAPQIQPQSGIQSHVESQSPDTEKAPHFQWRLGFYPFNKSNKDKDQDYRVHIW